MVRKAITSLALVSISTMALANANGKAKPGDWARYSLLLIKKNARVSVEYITLTVGKQEKGLRWWEMTAGKPDGSTFIVRTLSERVPMTGAGGDIGRVARYLFKDGSRPFVEYKHKLSGEPALPAFDFRDRLVPNPTPGASFEGVFAATGRYLGNGVQVVETGRDKPWAETGETKVLALDPELIVGTGRWIRETDEGRVTERDYNYRPLEPQEYDELETAGFNFFIADGAERESWIRERAVFYTKWPTFEDYPNILYRGNYLGTVMFTDEPAILTDFSSCRRVTDAANLLRMVVTESVAGLGHYSPRMLAAHLEKVGVYLGTWNLVQWDIPAWEAVYTAAYNEMEGGVSGVVHEGRYQQGVFNSVLHDFFGPGLEVTPDELLKLHYAFLRGAARCFHGDWGTSIYGQADPGISPLAVRMAYDMGARYVWFWTSDHGHHLPYREQLELARILREHEKARPRPRIKSLLQKAKVAVAVPEGYMGWAEYWPAGIWNNERFGFKKLNEEGVTYGSVIAAAMREGLALVRKGIAFDFVVDGEPARDAGYERVIRVLPNGTLSDERLLRHKLEERLE